MTTVYFDNAASSLMDERVLEAMTPYFFDIYAVPTSEFGYSMGIEAKEALDRARETIAHSLSCSSEEIIFTSGSTESSNLALRGVAHSLKKKKGTHIVTSTIEDFPVLNTAKSLEKEGFEVTYIGVDSTGRVDLEALEASLREDTILVSIQHANQEIGTLQDIASLSALCKERDILFHTDATHTFTRVPLDLNRVPTDLVTLSPHTFHGPRGIGALCVKKGTPLSKIMEGGFQESNLRPGLENIPAAVGFAKAVELVTPQENEHLTHLRDTLLEGLLSTIPDTILNGHRIHRIPHNANVTFHYVEGESITLHLDMRGFAVSTGSACFSRSLEASHVIMGIGGDHERAHGSVRFTLGRFNTQEEITAIIDALSEIITRLREISPLGK
ncbi:MAG: cysteine desulfurase [Theionarchaea archaeon]|nr:cysteine desulfurase [Theionarchaea archaeon]